MKYDQRKNAFPRKSLAILIGLSPLMMGATSGCDAFRDSMVASLETATAAALNAVVASFFDGFDSNSL